MIKEGLVNGLRDEAGLSQMLARLDLLEREFSLKQNGVTAKSTSYPSGEDNLLVDQPRDLTLMVVRNEFVTEPARLQLQGVRNIDELSQRHVFSTRP
eukprot:SAG31_NODE_4159_length_3524_cov_2.556788_2_plen_97_part_00